jgi:FixJ family two-component response regulator
MTGGAPTVFVVDDDPSVRRGVERLLRSAGLAAESFASAHDFLERYDCDAAGCVILDLAMPGFDGLQMQQVLADRGSALPIIFLTGHGDIPSGVRAMKRGAVDFLTKPVNGDDLLTAARNAIGRCEARYREREEIAGIRRRFATLTSRTSRSVICTSPSRFLGRPRRATQDRPSRSRSPSARWSTRSASSPWTPSV